ncbi:hypothetical protein M427DRAFT_36327 [Gonapodya prolifera JEL478]|uniref:Uncharacterized protein n=1 Tax=Gonapodya prolifera (strain JEL478) TaxID=1344416 RepID=A0A139A308_GONPJ|nr:hypothetical protein M427DRAFT_36327 [Gonapodya prolifera JEL478]|eukprot:KXS11140.1 hypothetical protein M427DRAFT_36327 [Gonapodya prolifera JEL478]
MSESESEPSQESDCWWSEPSLLQNRLGSASWNTTPADVNPFLDVEAGVEGGEEESESSDTDEETPSNKDMIDDGDEGDQGAGEGGDDKNLPPPQPGEPPVGTETRPTQGWVW